MDVDVIRKYVKRQPFRRFVLHLSDGQAMEVRHPDFVLVTEGLVVVVDRDGLPSIIDPDQVVSIEYRRGSKGA